MDEDEEVEELTEEEALEEARGMVWQLAFDAAKPARRVSPRAGNDVVALYLTRWIARDSDRLASFLSEHEKGPDGHDGPT